MTTTNGGDNKLTIEKIEKLIAAIEEMYMPTVYYCEAVFIPAGKIAFVTAQKTEILDTPAFFMVHPDDVERLKAETAGYIRLIHMRERKP